MTGIAEASIIVTILAWIALPLALLPVIAFLYFIRFKGPKDGPDLHDDGPPRRLR